MNGGAAAITLPPPRRFFILHSPTARLMKGKNTEGGADQSAAYPRKFRKRACLLFILFAFKTRRSENLIGGEAKGKCGALAKILGGRNCQNLRGCFNLVRWHEGASEMASGKCPASKS